MIRALFVDIGGVLLTNGWDHNSRGLACATFGLDVKEFESRHALTFDVYEIGKISLTEYLKRVVFYTERSFTQNQFEAFMFEQSQVLDGMIDMLVAIKKQYGLKVAALSNEGRELTEYRIKKFELDRLFDFYVSSCFVHLRKPDPEIYQFGLDIAQVTPKEVIYIDDRAFFAEVGSSLGLPAIIHTDLASTQKQLHNIVKLSMR